MSLEKYNYKKGKIRLTSPHSLMACEILGIDEDDLTLMTREEYLRNNQDCQYISKDLQDERYNHYNTRKIKLLEEAKNKRIELIKEEEDIDKNSHRLDTTNNISNNNINKVGHMTFYSPKNIKKCSSMGMMMVGMMTGSGWGTSTAIKLEKEKLRKIRERQEINMKLQIDYECGLEETRRKNIRKMKLKEEKDEKMRIAKNKLLMEKMRKEQEKEKNRKKKEEEIKKWMKKEKMMK